jgi:hypothetical protein
MLIKYDNTAAELIVSVTVPGHTTPAMPGPTPEQQPSKPTINLAETQRQALRVTKISQNKGVVSVCWQDPNPDRRTYRVDSLRITSESSLARQAAVAPDVGSDKFSPEEFAAERLKLSKIFENASKHDNVVKIWSPVEKLDLRESGNATFVANFPAQPNAAAMRIRISSVLPDGSTSPVQTQIRIPLVQPPPRRWPVKTILLTLVALAALAAVAVLVRKKIGKNR